MLSLPNVSGVANTFDTAAPQPTDLAGKAIDILPINLGKVTMLPEVGGGGGGYSVTIAIWVCAAQRGRIFGTSM